MEVGDCPAFFHEADDHEDLLPVLGLGKQRDREETLPELGRDPVRRKSCLKLLE